MSRYIEFNDAVKVMACEMYAEAQSQGYDVDGIEDFMPEAKAWLNDAPSIDIVFCKECKHWDTHTMQFAENNLVIARCKQWLQYSRMNGYCHNGERKESE